MKQIILIISLVVLSLISSCGKKDDVTTPTPAPTPHSTKTTAPLTPQTVSGTVYIINGSSDELYGIYLSETTDGNPGENIIGGSVLGEGEEIEFAFTDITANELFVTVEDASGNQYTAKSGINLKDGLIVELRLFDGNLEIITA